MKDFWNGVLDRAIVFLFLLTLTILSIFSPRLAVKAIDDFAED